MAGGIHTSSVFGCSTYLITDSLMGKSSGNSLCICRKSTDQYLGHTSDSNLSLASALDTSAR